MSILRVFSDAATGAFSPQGITPVPRTPSVQSDPRPQPKKDEDAAKVSLSSAAREFATTSLDAGKQAEVSSEAAATASVEEKEVENSIDALPAATSKENGSEEQAGDSGSENSPEQSPAEQREVTELQARDREVRTHEQSHLNSLGQHRAGGASYQFTTGPDGKQYAVAGEVPVNISPGSTPEETVSKAQTIRRAALAPAEPSGADRSVAAAASQLEAEARAELNSGSEAHGENAEVSSATQGPLDELEASESADETALASAEEDETSRELPSTVSTRAFEQAARFSSDSANAPGSLLNLQA